MHQREPLDKTEYLIVFSLLFVLNLVTCHVQSVMFNASIFHVATQLVSPIDLI